MSDRTEFIAIGWTGILCVFAAGFMFAEALDDSRTAHDWAGAFFLGCCFLLIARSDAKTPIGGGQYLRRFLTWRRTV